MLRVLADEYRSRLDRGRGNGPGAHDVEGADDAEQRAELIHRLRRIPEAKEALNRMWPRLSPHELGHDLLGARPLLAAAGKGILTADEV